MSFSSCGLCLVLSLAPDASSYPGVIWWEILAFWFFALACLLPLAETDHSMRLVIFFKVRYMCDLIRVTAESLPLPSSQLPGSASAFQHPSTLFCVNTSQPPSIMIILPYSSGQLIRGGRKLGYCNRTCWWGKSNRRPCWNPHYPYKAAKPHGSFLFCLFFVLSLLIKSGEGYHWLQTQQKPPKLKLHSGACPFAVTLQEKTVMWTFSVRPFVLGGS